MAAEDASVIRINNNDENDCFISFGYPDSVSPSVSQTLTAYVKSVLVAFSR
jgi:hypothetical protein